jgi:hypothetical protein
MAMKHRMRFACAAVVVAAASAGTTFVAGAVATEDAPPAPTGAPSYAAVQRSTQDPTERVDEMTEVMARRFPDIADAEPVGVQAGDGTQTWVVAGERTTCFGADNGGGTGYTCAPNSVAASTALSVMDRRQDGSTRAVFLVPDAVRSVAVDGRELVPSRNVVVAELPATAKVQALRRDGSAVGLAH